RAAFFSSTSVNTRCSKRVPKRSSEFWIRSILQRSEPRPMIIPFLPRSQSGGGGPSALLPMVEGACASSAHVPRYPSDASQAARAPSTIWLKEPNGPPPPASHGEDRRAPSPRLVHQRAHALHDRREAVEDCLPDQEMADVELAQLRDRR